MDHQVIIPELIGVYIPRNFAWKQAEVWEGIDPSDLNICKTGPGHPEYWDAWDNILANAYFIDSTEQKWRLYQEGDLIAYTGSEEENFGGELFN